MIFLLWLCANRMSVVEMLNAVVVCGMLGDIQTSPFAESIPDTVRRSMDAESRTETEAMGHHAKGRGR